MTDPKPMSVPSTVPVADRCTIHVDDLEGERTYDWVAWQDPDCGDIVGICTKLQLTASGPTLRAFLEDARAAVYDLHAFVEQDDDGEAA